MRIYRQSSKGIQEVGFSEVERFVNYYNEIEVDTETTGFDPILDDLQCVQLGCPEYQYLLVWDKEFIPFFQQLFTIKSKTFIFQNAKFDLKFFYKHGIFFPHSNIYDTFLAESIIYCGLNHIRKDLKSLATRYLKEDLDKSIRSEITSLGLTPEVIKYALNDVKYLTRIKHAQEKIIAYNNLTNALRLDNSFVRALAYVEYCGIGFNAPKWLEKAQKDRKALDKARKDLDDFIIQNNMTEWMEYGDLFMGEGFVVKINWNSDKDVIKFFERLGFDLWVEEEGQRKKSASSKVIGPQKHKHPITPVYLEYAKYQKRCSTFGEGYLKFVHPETGRIHTTYKQIVNTGRMSCGNTKENKPNLQQVPSDEEHRDCFIPKKGNLLIAADYSGQEAVVFANKCLDTNLLKFYDEGLGDMHSYVAKLCFKQELADIPLEEVKDVRKDLRQAAKAAGFAIQFGGNGFTISNNLGIPESEGNEIYTAYMEAFPEVKDYFAKVSEFTLQTGYVHFNEITNRRSYMTFYKEFLEIKAKVKAIDWRDYRKQKQDQTDYFVNVLKPLVTNYFRQVGRYTRAAYNYPVQGTAADITKTAACMIFNKIIKNGWFNKVLFTHIVHDEILVECPEDMVDTVAELVQACMEHAGDIFYTRVPLKATPVAGKVWKH